jgi:hypothetical protein
MNNENNKYAAIDTSIIDNISNNSNFNIQNLMKLSKDTELYIFNKKYKKWSLKSKDKLIKECENIKKKEIKKTTSILSNLAKINPQSNDIKSHYNILENKISKLDDIVSCLNEQNEDTIELTNILENKDHKILDLTNVLKDLSDKETDSSSSYIELYSNC